ncbi:MAG: DNA repair protein RecO [Deltaproteobacteria bacterium]|nr:DNA repair protein RecO [Deltaproteobacteria bacterium]
MKTLISPAIIMRVREIGESDLLVTFFTPERGQVKGVAKGARKSRKRFTNCLATFSLVSLEFGWKKEGGLCLLHSGKLLDAYPALRSDFGTLSRASYLIELTEVLFPPGVEEPKMFELLKGSLQSLALGIAPDLSMLLFEARALALGGYAIHTGRCCCCGRSYTGSGTAVFRPDRGGIACLRCQGESPKTPPVRPAGVKALQAIQEGAVCECGDLNLTDEEVMEVRAVLRLHREYRLEHRLKTLRYVE